MINHIYWSSQPTFYRRQPRHLNICSHLLSLFSKADLRFSILFVEPPICFSEIAYNYLCTCAVNVAGHYEIIPGKSLNGPFQGFWMALCTNSRLFEGPETFLAILGPKKSTYIKDSSQTPIQGPGRKSKICLRPSNMFCLFIEFWILNLSVVEAILKYYWRVLNVTLNKSPISIISPRQVCSLFNLTFNRGKKNGKYIISSKNNLQLKNQKRFLVRLTVELFNEIKNLNSISLPSLFNNASPMLMLNTSE